ncbi:DeoR/GlpR family DNA-binding transcription regulator [Staphylococcus arlettae]|uniref:DeoR/GlpR family DNA-binding transcription regulator n=1 Tax=Staphylococcus arlettae TaxID=29378 RepID=UPI001E49CC35|nr:DeoR/GlpR family DNA-binding transcription regulator [Staphylococcus arlettae]MCD8833556.1 DeoR/GlpR family DNA-binding transcription regulator [Staphylococcus arlettae]
MLPADREQRIITFLQTNKQATVRTLATEFNVHAATIRRDLHKLEQFNQIKRTHGGVVLNNTEVWDELNFDDRETTFYDEKRRIGQKAADFVDDNDTLIIDSGSTTLHFAHALKSKHNLTIITNDIYIASLLKSSGHHIIVTGGSLHPDNYVLNGALTLTNLSSFNPLKLFLATPAIDAHKGVTHYNDTLAATKRQMVAQAKAVYVLADSSKFDKVSLYSVCNPQHITTLITDNTHSDINWDDYQAHVEQLIIIDPPTTT